MVSMVAPPNWSYQFGGNCIIFQAASVKKIVSHFTEDEACALHRGNIVWTKL